MTTPEQCNGAPLVVYIEGGMTIYRAAEIKQKLLTPIVESRSACSRRPCQDRWVNNSKLLL
jgi:hypothetical protein